MRLLPLFGDDRISTCSSRCGAAADSMQLWGLASMQKVSAHDSGRICGRHRLRLPREPCSHAATMLLSSWLWVLRLRPDAPWTILITIAPGLPGLLLQPSSSSR